MKGWLTHRKIVSLLALLLIASHLVAQTAPGYDALIQKGNAQLQGGDNDFALSNAQSAIKLNVNRWEAYALAGGALMNLKQYEKAADQFSKAIELAPQAKQTGLRDLRKQCLLTEAGASQNFAITPAPTVTAVAATTTQAEIVLWKTIENSSNLADFQSYLDQYPNGAFAVLAKRHLTDAMAAIAWKDPATGLIWTKKDSGRDMNWRQASNYCQNLNLGGILGWRLPTIDQLASIYDPTQDVNGRYIKGGIQMTGWSAWSSAGSTARSAWTFSFMNSNLGTRVDALIDPYPGTLTNLGAVLCVRRSE